MDYAFEDSREILFLSKLVISINSLDKLVDGNGFEPFKILVIDEISQVLEHLSGDTFSSSESLRAFQLLEFAIERADQVILMDANIPNYIVDWVIGIRTDVTVIENTYQNPDPGDWTFYAHKDSALGVALDYAQQGKRIAIATGLEESKRLEMQFKRMDKDISIRVVNGENSSSPDVARFLNDPDKEMPQVLIFSPAIGSGVDIQTPFDAVFLIDTIGMLSAHDLVQMVGRFRNCRERHSYVKALFLGKRETNRDRILEHRLEAAIRTGQWAGFDKNGQVIFTEAQQKFDALLSHFDADRNRSLNDLPAHLYSLAIEGKWNVHFMEDKPNEDAKETTRNITKDAKEKQKSGILSAPIVDDDKYQELATRNALTQKAIWGNEKYKLLSYLGKLDYWDPKDPDAEEPILTQSEYDAIHTDTNRRKLDRYCSLRANDDLLAGMDREQYSRLLRRRQHWIGRKKVTLSLMNTFFKNPDAEYTAEEIEKILTQWRLKNPDAADHLPITAFRQQTAYKILKHILNLAGIKIKRIGQKRNYTYILDKDHLEYMDQWAKIRFPVWCEDAFLYDEQEE